MAGHSHWAGIKHKKGKADKKRSNIFSKLSREIIVAAKPAHGFPLMIRKSGKDVKMPSAI